MANAKIDYEEIIRRLSKKYEEKGRVGHDSLLDSLKEEIGEESYKILQRVVVGEYLEKERSFGAFPEREIRGLALKCVKLEEFNIPLQ
ncbi:MAG: hypothetical protein ABIH28_00865 [archaeon]